MVTRKRSQIGDFWLAHPTLDVLPVIGIGVLLGWFQPGYETVTDQMGPQFYGGTATFAGLALAAATFACSTTYQSANVLLSRVRRANARLLRRNWTWVILSLIACGVIPLLAMLLDGLWPTAALTVTLMTLAAVTTSAVRAVSWLAYTLWMDVLEEEVPEPVPTPSIAPQFTQRW